MQEKENTVFIVATANDISKIPAEFLRKGRFDELFYVDFPNDEERRKIIEIHLKKRHKWNKELDIISLVKLTSGYNGADLEAIVKDAIESCFIEGREQLTTDDLKSAQKNIKSISSTLEKRIKEIKEAVKDMDLKPASNPENKVASKPALKKVVEPSHVESKSTGTATSATSTASQAQAISALGSSLSAILRGYSSRG